MTRHRWVFAGSFVVAGVITTLALTRGERQSPEARPDPAAPVAARRAAPPPMDAPPPELERSPAETDEPSTVTKPDAAKPESAKTGSAKSESPKSESVKPGSASLASVKGGETIAGKGVVTGQVHRHRSPADRLGLPAKTRARSEKCLANAVSFESRGEPVRGQIAVAQAVMNRVLGLAPGRSLPAFAPSLHRWFARPRPRAGRGDPLVAAMTRSTRPRVKVVLCADCFATYNEPHVGQAAVRVLEALGYEVELPRIACCGRAMISTGLLGAAIASADRALATLRPAAEGDSVRAVVVCEPSCLSAITDDWLMLKLDTPLALRKKLAGKSMLVEDFIERFWTQHPKPPAIRKNPPAVVLHGHCHQKALGGDETSARLLRRLTGGRLTVLPSGCCGMAGSFGYLADKYDVSMAVGELSVFPPIRLADADTVVCAPGTSCRHQIKDGTGRRAIHPIALAADLLCP